MIAKRPREGRGRTCKRTGFNCDGSGAATILAVMPIVVSFSVAYLVNGTFLKSVRIVDLQAEGSGRAPNMVETQARCQACAASIQRLNGVNDSPLKGINSEVGSTRERE